MKRYALTALLIWHASVMAQERAPEPVPAAQTGASQAEAANIATLEQCRKWYDDHVHLSAAGMVCVSDTLGMRYHLLRMFVLEKLENQCSTHANRQNKLADVWQQEHPADGMLRSIARSNRNSSGYSQIKKNAAVRKYCNTYRNHVEELFVRYLDEGIHQEIDKAVRQGIEDARQK